MSTLSILSIAVVILGVATLTISFRMDKLEKKMDDYNDLVRLMAERNVQLRETDNKVLNLLTRTLDNVQENAESAKSAMNLCVDILRAVKGDNNEQLS